MIDDPIELRGAKVLVVDDVAANLDLLINALEPEGYVMLAAPSGEVALEVAHKANPEVVLLDVSMPGLNGFETCQRLKADNRTANIPVIFITAHDEMKSMVEGFRAGGIDYITKPFKPEEVQARVRTHLRVGRLFSALTRRNDELREEIERRKTAEAALDTREQQLSLISKREVERWGIEGLLSHSPMMERVFEEVRRLQAHGNASVLVYGESGTGKELVARALHSGSARKNSPFLAVNCSAVPEHLAESSFFGHVKGAFSGATQDQKGYFELAHDGTLFLDEVGEMPLQLQAKLLRVLEDGKVMPVGGGREKTVNVRVVAATNRDLRVRIQEGHFRQDLFFRLARFTVTVPPLRERVEDIPLLADHFLRIFAIEMGRGKVHFTPEAKELLSKQNYPGNVRELKNVVERGLLNSQGQRILPENLTFDRISEETGMSSKNINSSFCASIGELPINLEKAELALIKRALAEANGNVSKAAELLGVNRARIYRVLAAAPEADGSK